MKSIFTIILIISLYKFNACYSQNIIETNLKTEVEIIRQELIDLNESNTLNAVESLKSVVKDNKMKDSWNWFTNIDAERFWASVEQARPILISGSTDGNTGSLFTELVTGRIGLVKLTFASVLTGSTDGNNSQTNLQTFLSGGGNAVLKADFPIFYLANLKESKNYNNLFLGAYLMPRISTILPALGGASSKAEYIMDTGLEIQTGVKTDNKKIGFFLRFRASETIVSDSFKEELGTGTAFFYLQGSLNVRFRELQYLC